MEMGKERWTGEKCHVNCERKRYLNSRKQMNLRAKKICKLWKFLSENDEFEQCQVILLRVLAMCNFYQESLHHSPYGDLGVALGNSRLIYKLTCDLKQGWIDPVSDELINCSALGL